MLASAGTGHPAARPRPSRRPPPLPRGRTTRLTTIRSRVFYGRGSGDVKRSAPA
jgi:hypothetical protein